VARSAGLFPVYYAIALVQRAALGFVTNSVCWWPATCCSWSDSC